MIAYTDGSTTIRVCWAHQPYLLPQGETQCPLKLVGVRLVGDKLQVAVLSPPECLRWASPENYLGDEDAERWAKRAFGTLPRWQDNKTARRAKRRAGGGAAR